MRDEPINSDMAHLVVGIDVQKILSGRLKAPAEYTVTLASDGTAGAWIMALIARPHKPRLATRFIDDFARHCYFGTAGEEHPTFPRRNKRGADDLDKPMTRLLADFRKGLNAGKRFNAALLDKLVKCPILDPAPASIQRFAVPISEALAEFHEIMDSRSARELHWQRYQPYVHLAAAMHNTALKQEWPLATDIKSEDALLKAVIFGDLSWIEETLQQAEINRQLAFIFKIGNPTKMENIVVG